MIWLNNLLQVRSTNCGVPDSQSKAITSDMPYLPSSLTSGLVTSPTSQLLQWAARDGIEREWVLAWCCERFYWTEGVGGWREELARAYFSIYCNGSDTDTITLCFILIGLALKYYTQSLNRYIGCFNSLEWTPFNGSCFCVCVKSDLRSTAKAPPIDTIIS